MVTGSAGAPAAAGAPVAAPVVESGAADGVAPGGVLPAECATADAALRAVLDVAGEADAWDGATRQAFLVWSAKHRDLVAVVEGKVLTAERDAGTWSLRGDRDLAGFVGRAARGGRGAGMAAVGQAGTLAAMPVVAEALVDGPVTSTHVQQITRAAAGSPLLAAELASPEGQAQLVELAGRLDGGEFGKALAQLSASLDPASRQRAHDEQRANRSFAWTHTPAGTLIKGRLDSVAGHKLAKAIDALCPRPTLDDDRSREARQADALIALVERAAADRTTTPGALAPVQAIVTFTQNTWTALRAARPAAHRAAGTDETGSVDAGTAATPTPGSTLDVIDRLRGVDPVVDETGQAWPASEIARALCDCALTRAVLDTPDAELNLGRESRAFKRQHWLALYAAGVTGCSIAGCGMPLAYCQLHHITWWQRDGGRTNQANCAAYCSYHHHEIHRLGIQITRQADGSLHHHHPDGRVYGAAPSDAEVGTPRAVHIGAGHGRDRGDAARDEAGVVLEARGMPSVLPVDTPEVVRPDACSVAPAGAPIDSDGEPPPADESERVPSGEAPSAWACSGSAGGGNGPPVRRGGAAARDPSPGSPPAGEPPLDLLELLTA